MEKIREGEVNPPADDKPFSSQAAAVMEESGPREEHSWEGYSLSTLSVFFDNC